MAPVLLLVLVAAVGVAAFAYTSDVNEDIDRKDDQAQVLSDMATSTARLGNLAALGSEPSLRLEAARDAFVLQATLRGQLRRWDELNRGEPREPAVEAVRNAQEEFARRLRQVLRGNERAGRATPAELAQGNRLYHRIDALRARVAGEASDLNATGDTKRAVVTGIAILFVIVLLAVVQLTRVRLRRVRRETAMREALHEATRESEERYRFVTDLVPDQIFTIGPDGRFDYMNERTAAFLGHDAEAGEADRWLDLHHPDDALHVQMAWSNAMNAGEPVEVESRMLGADGSYHWILTRAIPQHDDEGRIVRWFCSGTDITGRQRHEQELREARQRLAEAQAIAHIGSWEWDVATDEVTWSDELHRLFGVATDTRLTYDSFLGLVHPDDRDRVAAVISAAVAEDRSYEFETRMIRPDGEERDFFCRGHVLAGGDGEPGRVVGVAQDITDRVRAERERDRLEGELQQAQRLESIGQLAGGVAHDFNNLLSVILNYASIVQDQVSDPRVKEDAAEIRRAAERAAALTRQLLTFGSREVVQPMDLDLNEVLHDMANMLRRTVGDSITLQLRLADELWQVRADRSQLEQVIVNLAVNARDAMPAGGVLRIETWNVEGRGGRGPRVRLVMRDEGVGMTPDVRDHAFEPFFTTKAPGEGTGLGLATVYGIVKSAGGEVIIDSAAGNGTAMTVELPAVMARATVTDDHTVPAGPSRILLVDDEEPVRRIASRILARHGYEVVAPTSPEQALAALSDADGGEFDLLLTDIVMPQMSGTELSVRARSHRPGLKVLYMSGYTDRADEVAAAAFLPKPFDEQTLLGKVRAALADGVGSTA